MIAKQERFGDDFEWHFIGSDPVAQDPRDRRPCHHDSLARPRESARDSLADLELPAAASFSCR